MESPLILSTKIPNLLKICKKVEKKKKRKEKKRETNKINRLYCTWDQEFNFDVFMPSLAFVRFQLIYRNIGCVAHFLAPLESLRQGLKFTQTKTKDNKKQKTTKNKKTKKQKKR